MKDDRPPGDPTGWRQLAMYAIVGAAIFSPLLLAAAAGIILWLAGVR